MEKAQQGGWVPFWASTPPSPWAGVQVFKAPAVLKPHCWVGFHWRTCECVIYRTGASTPIFLTADPGLLECSAVQAPVLPGRRGH